MKKYLTIFGLLFILLLSCNQEDLPPKVYLPSPLSSSISTEDTVYLEFTATDDNRLTSAGFSILPAFDSIPGTLRSWRLRENITIGSNTYFFSDSMDVPDSINAGNYLLKVFATDASGFSDTITDQFTISSKLDSLSPVLDTIIAPDSLMEGDDLTLNFKLSDDNKLAYAQYKLVSRVNDSLLLENDALIVGLDYSGSVVLQNIGDFQRVRFEIIFYDWVHNKVRETTDIIIKEN